MRNGRRVVEEEVYLTPEGVAMIVRYCIIWTNIMDRFGEHLPMWRASSQNMPRTKSRRRISALTGSWITNGTDSGAECSRESTENPMCRSCWPSRWI
jgi:hypothetical protein